MNEEPTPRNVLVKRWKKYIFEEDIFPGFPFKSKEWKAIAFNRDLEGNIRLPRATWAALLRRIRDHAGSEHACIVSPDAITSGAVAQVNQPVSISLTEKHVIDHFSDMNLYMPEFFMADESTQWAIWGDSDLTVVGGDCDLIMAAVDERGGIDAATRSMLQDFGLTDASEANEMEVYLKGLLGR